MDREQRKQFIEQRLSSKLVPIDLKDRLCFCTPAGGVVVVDVMPGENALVLGYAENLSEAELNRFEDGDRFFVDEMTEDQMLQAMIHEIFG